MYRVHTGTSLFQCFGTSFLSFLKGTSVYILVFSEYIHSDPRSFSGRSGPAGLPAGDSCSATRIQPKHTQAALMTRPWHHPCHAFLPPALRGRLLQLAVRLHQPSPPAAVEQAAHRRRLQRSRHQRPQQQQQHAAGHYSSCA